MCKPLAYHDALQGLVSDVVDRMDKAALAICDEFARPDRVFVIPDERSYLSFKGKNKFRYRLNPAAVSPA